MAEDEAPPELKEEVTELAPFDPTKKKKKKKVLVQDAADEATEKVTEKMENLSVTDGVDSAFTGMRRKKKKPVEGSFQDDDNVDSTEDAIDNFGGEDEEGEGIILQARYPWEGTDRDYKYEELLDRVFNILRENNPELAGEKRRTVMRPPQVLREGTKKTVFVNFMDLCKTMHRQPEHVMTFLQARMSSLCPTGFRESGQQAQIPLTRATLSKQALGFISTSKIRCGIYEERTPVGNTIRSPLSSIYPNRS